MPRFEEELFRGAFQHALVDLFGFGRRGGFGRVDLLGLALLFQGGVPCRASSDRISKRQGRGKDVPEGDDRVRLFFEAGKDPGVHCAQLRAGGHSLFGGGGRFFGFAFGARREVYEKAGISRAVSSGDVSKKDFF